MKHDDLEWMEEQAVRKRDGIEQRLGIDYEYFVCRLKRAADAACIVDAAADQWAGFLTALPKTRELVFFVYGDREKEESFKLEDWKVLIEESQAKHSRTKLHASKSHFQTNRCRPIPSNRDHVSL